MPVLLSRADAQRSAMACRALGYKIRKEVEGLSTPSIVAGKIAEAVNLERLAAMYEAHAATPRPTSPVPDNVTPLRRK